jgi:hypothetical protein
MRDIAVTAILVVVRGDGERREVRRGAPDALESLALRVEPLHPGCIFMVERIHQPMQAGISGTFTERLES